MRSVVPDRRVRLAPMSRFRISLILPTLALVAALVVGCVQVSGATTAPAATGSVGQTTTQNAALPGSSNAPVANAVSSPSATSAAADPFSPVVDIVKKAQPSVVTVLTDQGLGSGIIYSADGYIVTNNHVVETGNSYTIAFASGEQVPATLVGTDPTTDVAILKVDKSNLPAAVFEQDLPQVGQLAVAIGSPLGFENTVTVGIVSGLQRTIPGSAQESQALVDLIQTDAAISPANPAGAPAAPTPPGSARNA